MSSDARRPAPWRVVPQGVVISVRLQPKASGDAIDGIVTLAGGSRSLKVRVRAQPEKGAANKALIKLLAKTLGRARSDLALIAGARDRNKTVAVSGDGSAIASLLEAAFADTGGEGGND